MRVTHQIDLPGNRHRLVMDPGKGPELHGHWEHLDRLAHVRALGRLFVARPVSSLFDTTWLPEVFEAVEVRGRGRGTVPPPSGSPGDERNPARILDARVASPRWAGVLDAFRRLAATREG